MVRDLTDVKEEVTMFWSDKKHRELFMEALQLKDKCRDNGYAAAIYILTSDEELRRKSNEGVFKDSGIKFEYIHKHNDFSGGYYIALNFAESLFNGNISVDLSDLCRVDEALYKTILQAIDIKYHWRILSVKEGINPPISIGQTDEVILQRIRELNGYDKLGSVVID